MRVTTLFLVQREISPKETQSSMIASKFGIEFISALWRARSDEGLWD
jgi:hypothetical protein